MGEAEKLFQENQKLVYFVLRRQFSQLAWDQDATQEGFIGLWNACLHYKGPGKFSSFAVACIRNAILQYLRKQRRTPCALSLDAPIGGEDGDPHLGDLLADESASAFEEDIFADDFMQRLTPHDRRLVELRVAGVKQQALGNIVGVSQVQISRRLKKIKTLYQKAGAGERT